MSESRIKRLEMRHTAAHEAQVKAGIANALATSEGRAMFWEILSLTGMFRNPHTGNALNSAFNSGRQSVGQDVFGMLEEINPHAYITMLQENLDKDLKLKKLIAEEQDDEDE